jgi:KRAB domain-containing zinc finger protein
MCDDCGKELSTMSTLELHKHRFHSEEKPYRCDECEQTLKEKVQMESHMVELHGKPNPRLRPECGKRFINARIMLGSVPGMV